MAALQLGQVGLGAAICGLRTRHKQEVGLATGALSAMSHGLQGEYGAYLGTADGHFLSGPGQFRRGQDGDAKFSPFSLFLVATGKPSQEQELSIW